MRKPVHFCGIALSIITSVVCALLGATAFSAANAQSPSATPLLSKDTIMKGSTVTNRATGTFDVKLSPQAPHHKDEAAPLG